MLQLFKYCFYWTTFRNLLRDVKFSHPYNYHFNTLLFNILGDCDTNAKECVCTGAELGAKHAKCIDDTVCSMWCQVCNLEMRTSKVMKQYDSIKAWSCSYMSIFFISRSKREKQQESVKESITGIVFVNRPQRTKIMR